MTFVRTLVREHPRAVGIGLLGAPLLAVILAVLALGGWFRPDQTGAVDPTPSPSVEPSQGTSPDAEPGEGSATPRPSPTVTGPYELTDVATPLFRSVWARVVVDELNVRRQPRMRADVVGKLSRGDLVLITGDPAGGDGSFFWAPIVADGISGWAAAGDEGDIYLQPIGTPWRFGSRRDFNGVVSNGSTFLAYGIASDLVVLPYEGSGASPLAYISIDGIEWTQIGQLHGNLWAAAGSPEGFVVVAQPTYIEPTTIWLSDDGLTWDEPIAADVNAPAAALGPAGPVVAGVDDDSGEILVIHPVESGAEPARIEADDISNPQLEGSSGGYVLFDRYGAVRILVSADGESWELVRVPGVQAGRNAIRDVELIGRRVVVVATRASDGGPVIREGTITDDGSVSWNPRTTLTGLDGTTVDSVSGDPDGTLLAFGWDRDVLEPMVWRSTDGYVWEDLGAAPNSLGGAIGPEPAFARGVWAAVTDTVYTSTDGSAWTQRLDPPAQPSGPGCPPLAEVTALDVLFLGGAAADCFGDEHLTFVAWAPLIEGLGGCCYPEGRPAWLNSPISGTWLAPAPVVAGGFGDAEFPVSLAPGAVDRLPAEAWVKVTGHFFDPASARCRNIPLTTFPHRLDSRAALIDACERRFVITEVVPADGPAG